MNPRSFIALVAAAVVLIAAILLLTGVTATTPAGESVSCGTAAIPDNSSGKSQSDSVDAVNGFSQLASNPRFIRNGFVGYALACSDSISTRRMWGYSLLGLGLVGLLGCEVVRTRRPEGPSKA